MSENLDIQMLTDSIEEAEEDIKRIPANLTEDDFLGRKTVLEQEIKEMRVSLNILLQNKEAKANPQ